MKILTAEIHCESKKWCICLFFSSFSKLPFFRDELYIKEKVLAHHTSNICKEQHGMTKNYDYNF